MPVSKRRGPPAASSLASRRPLLQLFEVRRHLAAQVERERALLVFARLGEQLVLDFRTRLTRPLGFRRDCCRPIARKIVAERTILAGGLQFLRDFRAGFAALEMVRAKFRAGISFGLVPQRCSR